MSTVDEYLNNAFTSRENDARDMLTASSDGAEYEGQDADDAISELPLAIDTRVHIVITLSMGGPSEQIDCEVSRGQFGEWELDRATFTVSWGFDSRTQRLYETDALYTLAERYIEGVEIGSN